MNSLIASGPSGGQVIKVRNFQALMDPKYNHAGSASDN